MGGRLGPTGLLASLRYESRRFRRQHQHNAERPEPELAAINVALTPFGAVSKSMNRSGGARHRSARRFWQHLQSFLHRRSSVGVGTHAMRVWVRCAQWVDWHRSKDLWLETGRMMQRLSARLG